MLRKKVIHHVWKPGANILLPKNRNSIIQYVEITRNNDYKFVFDNYCNKTKPIVYKAISMGLSVQNNVFYGGGVTITIPKHILETSFQLME